MKFAICISGLARTYKKTYESFWIHVVNTLRERGSVDIFISTWDKQNISTPSIDLVQNTSTDIADIVSLYKPRVLEVESFDSIKNTFLLSRFTQRRCPIESLIKDGILFSIPGQYKIMKCNNLKRRIEIQEEFRYDLVLRTRFDFDITRINIDEIKLDKMNCLYDHCGTIGDYFYVAGSRHMDTICDLFNNYPYILNLQGTDMGPERNLKNHIISTGIATNIIKGYTYALVRENFRQEFYWDDSEGYVPRVHRYT